MTSPTMTRRDYILAGVGGLVMGLGLMVVLYIVAPYLTALAFLARESMGSGLPAAAFLLVLGLIALGEFPLMLYALIRTARSQSSAWVLLGMHATYTFLPAVYGAVGTILTGEVWWLGVMVLLGFFRLMSSAVGVDPIRLAADEQKKKAKPIAADTPTLVTDMVAIEDPVTLTPNQEPNYSVFQKPIAAPVRPLGTIRGYVLDMDGVLYHGERVRAGTIAFVNYLNRNGIPYVCLTNNASRTRDQYAEKLERLGIPIGGEHVIGAAQATAEWLAERAPDGARMLVVGEQGLRDELTRVGFTLVETAPADYVVVGIDFNLTYTKLKEAALALRQRATFIGTNPDLTYPSEEGIVPGNGSQLAYLQAATGKTPTLVGKPSAAMMQVALAHLNLPAAQVAMVGDRLDTDILGGKTVGMSTILLRGGVTNATELAASEIQPDYVMDDLAALLEELERA